MTVIVPAWQAHDTIVATVESLLAQSFIGWQAVIVADDATDYRSQLAALGITDSRLRFATTGRIGAGPSAARNVGLDATRAPLVAPLDADDRFAPDRLARLVPLAIAAGAAFDNVAVVREADDQRVSTLFPPDDADLATLSLERFLATSVPMFPVCRRDLAGRWDENLRFAEDVLFNLRLLARLDTAAPLSLRPLYRYRVRSGSLSTGPGATEAAEHAYTTLLARLDARTLGLTNPSHETAVRAHLIRKRALNRAFAASGAASFQDWLATAGEQ